MKDTTKSTTEYGVMWTYPLDTILYLRCPTDDRLYRIVRDPGGFRYSNGFGGQLESLHKFFIVNRSPTATDCQIARYLVGLLAWERLQLEFHSLSGPLVQRCGMNLDEAQCIIGSKLIIIFHKKLHTILEKEMFCFHLQKEQRSVVYRPNRIEPVEGSNKVSQNYLVTTNSSAPM